MEEEKFKEVMDSQDFENYIYNSLNLRIFDAVHKFKSVGRAFRRGHITSYGFIIPKRPFNNRANTSKRKGVDSRYVNKQKKLVYEQLRASDKGRV